MIDFTRQRVPSITEVQGQLAAALDACGALGKDYAALIVHANGLRKELGNLRGAYDMAAESRDLWKLRALGAGWQPESLAPVEEV